MKKISTLVLGGLTSIVANVSGKEQVIPLQPKNGFLQEGLANENFINLAHLDFMQEGFNWNEANGTQKHNRDLQNNSTINLQNNSGIILPLCANPKKDLAENVFHYNERFNEEFGRYPTIQEIKKGEDNKVKNDCDPKGRIPVKPRCEGEFVESIPQYQKRVEKANRYSDDKEFSEKDMKYLWKNLPQCGEIIRPKGNSNSTKNDTSQSNSSVSNNSTQNGIYTVVIDTDSTQNGNLTQSNSTTVIPTNSTQTVTSQSNSSVSANSTQNGISQNNNTVSTNSTQNDNLNRGSNNSNQNLSYGAGIGTGIGITAGIIAIGAAVYACKKNQVLCCKNRVQSDSREGIEMRNSNHDSNNIPRSDVVENQEAVRVEDVNIELQQQ